MIGNQLVAVEVRVSQNNSRKKAMVAKKTKERIKRVETKKEVVVEMEEHPVEDLKNKHVSEWKQRKLMI